MMVSKNVAAVRNRELSRAAGFQLAWDLGKYLGVPLIHKQQNKETYSYILERAQKKLTSWKTNCLAMAGIITLSQADIVALPTYTMQTVLLPKGVCRQLEKIASDFIWGANRERSWHSIGWNRFCRPKELGGVGLRLHAYNRAILMKAGWSLARQPGAFWVQVVRGKYQCWGGGITSIWKDIKKGSNWRIGDGRKANFWHDRWLPSGTIIAEVVDPRGADIYVEQKVGDLVDPYGE